MTNRCTATSKQRKARCKQPAIPGGRVCRYHGGKAPQVVASAKERLEALVHPALNALEGALRHQDIYAVLRAARDLLDRAGLRAPREVKHFGGFTLEQLVCAAPIVDDDGIARLLTRARSVLPDVPSGTRGGSSEASTASGPLAVAAERRAEHDEPVAPATASTRGDEQESEAFDTRPWLGPSAAAASTAASTGALDVLGESTDRPFREQLRGRFPYLRRESQR